MRISEIKRVPGAILGIGVFVPYWKVVCVSLVGRCDRMCAGRGEGLRKSGLRIRDGFADARGAAIHASTDAMHTCELAVHHCRRTRYPQQSSAVSGGAAVRASQSLWPRMHRFAPRTCVASLWPLYPESFPRASRRAEVASAPARTARMGDDLLRGFTEQQIVQNEGFPVATEGRSIRDVLSATHLADAAQQAITEALREGQLNSAEAKEPRKIIQNTGDSP